MDQCDPLSELMKVKAVLDSVWKGIERVASYFASLLGAEGETEPLPPDADKSWFQTRFPKVLELTKSLKDDLER